MDVINSEGKKQQFYCPVKDCPRGVDGGKPFPRLGQLKQVRSDIKRRSVLYQFLDP